MLQVWFTHEKSVFLGFFKLDLKNPLKSCPLYVAAFTNNIQHFS